VSVNVYVQVWKVKLTEMRTVLSQVIKESPRAMLHRKSQSGGFAATPTGSMNTHGREGPATADIPGGTILLPFGTMIKLRSLNGEVVDSECTGLPAEVSAKQGDDAESLTLEWTSAFTIEVRVPDDCISFAWTRDGLNGYVVTALFHPLAPERLDVLGPDFVQVCFVCAGPCDDADDNNSRELSCIECHPCFLCDRCKVHPRRSLIT